MCTQCFTSAEAVALNSVGLAAMASGAVTAVWSRLRHPATPVERAGQQWDRSARSLRTLGYDPVATLGPRPGASPAKASPPAGGRPSGEGQAPDRVLVPVG